MLVSKHEVYSIAGDLHSRAFYTPVELTGKLKDLKGSKDLIFFEILHCDGLMLCDLCSTEVNTKLVVWNPCTGQTRNIEPRTCYDNEDKYAIGYSRSSSSSSCGHSYKILRYSRYENEQKVWVAMCEIYELSSDSWRVHDSLTLDYYILLSGMSLEGDTYWVAEDKETGFFLMKFDFMAERLVRIHVPFKSIISGGNATLSVVKDEKLSLLQLDDMSMRIWVSNKINDEEEAKDFSWRSYLVMQMDFDKFHFPDVESFLLDEENKMAVCCGSKHMGDGHRTSIYVVGEDMYEQVYEDTMESDLGFPVVLTYIPSLVLI